MSGKKLEKLVRAIKAHNAPDVKRIADKLANCYISEAAKCAVGYGSLAVVEAMPRNFFLGKDQSFLLLTAVERGLETICTFLLGNDLDPNVQDEEMNTPLHYACKIKNREIMRLLIQSGANPHIRNKSNLTPRDLVQQFNDSEEYLAILDRKELMKALNEKINKMESSDMRCMEGVLEKLDGVLTKLSENNDYVHVRSDVLLRNPPYTYTDKTESPYAILDCDFLKGDARRNFDPEEAEHIRSKLIYLMNNLKCIHKVKEIVDRMYGDIAMSLEQMETLAAEQNVRDKVRHLVIKVILANNKLHGWQVFLKALKEVKEDSIRAELLQRAPENVTKL